MIDVSVDMVVFDIYDPSVFGMEHIREYGFALEGCFSDY